MKTPSLSCSSYLRNMDRLTPAAIDEISFRMAQRLIAQGQQPVDRVLRHDQFQHRAAATRGA